MRQVIELRQYTVDIDHRDELIDLFHTSFAPGQRSVGIDVPGVDAEADHPDRIVWWRTFPNLEGRGDALRAFCNSAVWKQYGAAFNDHLIDYSNALMLQFQAGEPAATSLSRPSNVTIIPTLPDGSAALAQQLSTDSIGSTVVATIGANNHYPGLPLRDDTNVVVIGVAPTIGRPHQTLRLSGNEHSTPATPSMNNNSNGLSDRPQVSAARHRTDRRKTEGHHLE